MINQRICAQSFNVILTETTRVFPKSQNWHKKFLGRINVFQYLKVDNPNPNLNQFSFNKDLFWLQSNDYAKLFQKFVWTEGGRKG